MLGQPVARGIASAARMIARVVTRKVPARVLIYAARAELNRWLKTGNNRFEFERIYLETPNPWEYLTSPYEHQKYERTLATLLKFRSNCGSALEIGCSIGVFTKVVAGHVQRLTAVDISKEALVVAAAANGANSNVRFVRGDLRSLDLGARYDVIFCAEVLDHVRERDAPAVCRTLDRHLDPQGIIITVGPHPPHKKDDDALGFANWDEVMAAHFRPVTKCIYENPQRPYEIAVFAAGPQRHGHGAAGSEIASRSGRDDGGC